MQKKVEIKDLKNVNQYGLRAPKQGLLKQKNTDFFKRKQKKIYSNLKREKFLIA